MARTQLPGRRGVTTVKVGYSDVEGLTLSAHVTYSRDDRGEIAECFVTAGKPGSVTEAMLRDAGLLVSLLLQHGATVREIQTTLTRNATGGPASQVGIVVDALVAEDRENHVEGRGSPEPAGPEGH